MVVRKVFLSIEVGFFSPVISAPNGLVMEQSDECVCVRQLLTLTITLSRAQQKSPHFTKAIKRSYSNLF